MQEFILYEIISTMKYYAFYESPVGRLMLAGDGARLTGLWIENQKYYACRLNQDAKPAPDLEIFKLTTKWLTEYFDKKIPECAVPPLAPYGTDFQKAVWQVLQLIPYGHTVTYGSIAKHMGTSARAVGNAVGHNPISILIPCHRVLGATGTLTGYAGGLNVKQALLKLEGSIS